MATETRISTASHADLAADMENHRHTYRGFLTLLKWAAAGSAIVLAVLFLMWV
jgi:hypothetical protein